MPFLSLYPKRSCSHSILISGNLFSHRCFRAFQNERFINVPTSGIVPIVATPDHIQFRMLINSSHIETILYLKTSLIDNISWPSLLLSAPLNAQSLRLTFSRMFTWRTHQHLIPNTLLFFPTSPFFFFFLKGWPFFQLCFWALPMRTSIHWFHGRSHSHDLMSGWCWPTFRAQQLAVSLFKTASRSNNFLLEFRCLHHLVERIMLMCIPDPLKHTLLWIHLFPMSVN